MQMTALDLLEYLNLLSLLILYTVNQLPVKANYCESKAVEHFLVGICTDK